jgi:pilus assembly protein FimV
MHSNKRSTTHSFNLKALSAAIVSALLFSNANAAGLGKLTVLSSLGQPLRAEIELTSVSKDEAGALAAKLASPEAFQQANIDLNAALLSLQFAVEQRGGRQFIRITSTQPLSEPFVDMLMELSSPNGRLIREYTFLLDPPDFRTAQSGQVAPLAVPEFSAAKSSPSTVQAAPAQQAAPTQQAVPVQKQADASKPATRAAGTQAAKPAPTAESVDVQEEEYTVKKGDSLAKIAGQLKSSGVSLDQMLVALYRTNPDAFIGKNMNRLRAGQILSVPSAEAATSISATEARSVVVAQSRDFNNYRNKLAEQVAKASAQQSVESKQSAGGKITAKVEEPSAPANESQDKLKLSKANTSAGTGAEKAGAPASAAEDKIAKEKAAAEASARVNELERNVNDLQQLLDVKSKSLAEQQNQADAKSTADAPAPVAPAAPAEAATSPTPVPAAPADSAAPADTAAGEKPAEAASDTAAQPAPAEAAAPVPPVAAKPKPVAPPPPAPEPSLVDEVLENPLTLPGIGILLAALGAFGIYSARRKKQKGFEDSIITDSSLKANSLFGSTGGQSVDTNNSVFNSNFTPSTSQLDSNEVDPVAEADVYIAYGRDAQAEEILKEALRTQPDRNAVRVKLLEIYSNRKDLRAFEVMATELYGLTKGEGEDWMQAAILGAAIDPNNPLYSAGKAASGSNSKPGTSNDQGFATRFSGAQQDNALETISGLDAETSYFSNPATPVNTPPASGPKPAPRAEPEPAPKAAPNDLDFDLEDFQNSIDVPNTIPSPAFTEPNADMASIDFDFLKEPAVVPEAPAAKSAKAAIPSMDNQEPVAPAADAAPKAMAPLSMDFPGLSDAPAAQPVKREIDAAPESMDFDLSGINLELNPAEAEPKPDLVLDTDDAFAGGDESSSSDAEMATKLDLAIAYQEIGDKEGARELLDEVLKGGSVEQSEKAKSLLLELA